MLAHDPLAGQFQGATVYQALLSAVSYHRWHAPVSGRIVRAFVEDGTYYSKPLFNDEDDEEDKDATDDDSDETKGVKGVGGLKMFQGYIAALATRAIIFIEADNPAIGLMAFIGIGMSEISTCDILVREGQRVRKGDELGTFRFGGSSHCLLFREGVELYGLPEVGREANVPVRGKLATILRGCDDGK